MKTRKINKNNTKESSKHVPHKYKVDNKVLVKNQKSTNFGQDVYKGPWTINKDQDNENVNITQGSSQRF